MAAATTTPRRGVVAAEVEVRGDAPACRRVRPGRRLGRPAVQQPPAQPPTAVSYATRRRTSCRNAMPPPPRGPARPAAPPRPPRRSRPRCARCVVQVAGVGHAVHHGQRGEHLRGLLRHLGQPGREQVADRRRHSRARRVAATTSSGRPPVSRHTASASTPNGAQRRDLGAAQPGQLDGRDPLGPALVADRNVQRMAGGQPGVAPGQDERARQPFDAVHQVGQHLGAGRAGRVHVLEHDRRRPAAGQQRATAS